MISLRDVVTGFGNRDPLAEVWRRSLRGGGGGSAEITGTLPLRYIGNGKPLTDYMIYGNTIQNGTPTPEAPVDVVGCGVWDETRQSYKLPPTVNGTEYPIYLGQVPTTRRVKKLALTGLESSWVRSDKRDGCFLLVNFGEKITVKSILCSHARAVTSSSELSSDNTCLLGNDFNLWFDMFSFNTNLQEFKQYLSDQYAAGTPVTIWYVLAEPEIGIVNEPLHKIGDYGDTISFAQAGVTIPTVSGANVLDMTSTVKPSEVYIKGNGIKPTNDPNFENGG